ncbi:MAG TPA: hypothetical protein VFB07_05025 [Vicinamibacterales bacterium]|nr:hypothetical protein [Vicinamibacterales bacterium]
MSRVLSVLSALAVAAVSASAAAQRASTTDATITGCLQRAPSSLSKQGSFVLMNASNSPMGGSVDTTTETPAEPARGHEPIERRPGQSDARQETGGVTYLLEGRADLESKIGQRVEITGTLGREVTTRPPDLPTMAQPVRTVKVKRVRAIAPSC